MNSITKKVPSVAVPASLVPTVFRRSVGVSILFLSGGFNGESESLYFFLIHLFDCSFCIIIIFEFLSDEGVTMKEYGPLYCMHTIFPNYLNQFLRSSLVVFLP